ncbi:sigma factor-like helix-turn-helix DNA-binding protein [Micromonospora carbonacea]|uniref:sigma factor-like helix-turn-helix DNA-binding protein n=1 Tax=Micromonospora carbonacea TaxID=47853 RepID=UPI003D728441
MNSHEVAEALGTTPKTLRAFLRSPSSTFRAVGSGARYEFTAADLPTLRKRFAEWSKSGKPKATTPKRRPGPHAFCAHPQTLSGNTACKQRKRDEGVWAEDGPVVLEDLADPDVRAKVRRIAAEQEARLELRLLAAGLHITQERHAEGPTTPTVRVKRPSAKLTDPQIGEIRSRYALGGITQKELGRKYGVSQTHVSQIVRSDGRLPSSQQA